MSGRPTVRSDVSSGVQATPHPADVNWDDEYLLRAANGICRPILAQQKRKWPEPLMSRSLILGHKQEQLPLSSRHVMQVDVIDFGALMCRHHESPSPCYCIQSAGWYW
jgi:hypothetical protein